MTSQMFGYLIVALLGGTGLLYFFAKDWRWDRYEATMRASGIVDLEPTPEWDRQQNVTGGIMIFVAFLLLSCLAGNLPLVHTAALRRATLISRMFHMRN